MRFKAQPQPGVDPFPRTLRACSLKLRDYLGFGVDGVVVVMFPFKVIGREVVQGRVAPVRVVPSLDPAEYGQACLGFGPPAASGNELALQSGKKAFGHGVVISVAHAAHGGGHAHLPAPVAKSDAGVLLGFKESSQHQLIELRIVGHSMLRQAFSIPEFYEAFH